MKHLHRAAFRSIELAISDEEIKLRPEPGSRVNFNPAHTQGAGMPVFGLPVKGKSPEKRRIEYPQRGCSSLKEGNL